MPPPQHVLGPRGAGHGEYRPRAKVHLKAQARPSGVVPPLQALVLVDLEGVGGKTLDQPLPDDGGQADQVADRREEADADQRDHVVVTAQATTAVVRTNRWGPATTGGGESEGAQEIGGGREVGHHGAGPQLVRQRGLYDAHRRPPAPRT